MERSKILQVITLLGSGGSYGGPLRVAFEIAEELNRKGHLPSIVGGVIGRGDFPTSPTVLTSGIIVKPISKKLKVSSLFSLGVPSQLWAKIRQSDVVHVHFGRDLVSITATLICILNKKSFYLQTHGMVKKDKRKLVRFVDRLLVKGIFKKANAVFVLQSEELSELRKLGFAARYEILPNGILVDERIDLTYKAESFVAVFCARLAPVKQVDRFLQIAKRASIDKLDATFEIFGPDGGELAKVLDFIAENDLENTLRYEGTVDPLEVPELLSRKSLLVLPSRYDPFPVSILEALGVGTPVLVNASCGISDIIKNLDDHFVSELDDTSNLYDAFLHLYENPVNHDQRIAIQKFTSENFSIQSVVEDLIEMYEKWNFKEP